MMISTKRGWKTTSEARLRQGVHSEIIFTGSNGEPDIETVKVMDKGEVIWEGTAGEFFSVFIAQQFKTAPTMKKIIVRVAWEREDADKAEEGKLEESKFNDYDFDTMAEAQAYIKGIDDGNGWDRPYAEIAEIAEITDDEDDEIEYDEENNVYSG